MGQLTLAQCFGANATQDINTLVIHKSDLPGLNAVSNNNAESLVVGLLLKWLENFEGTITTQDGKLTAGNTPITFNQGDIATSFNMEYWRVIFRSKLAVKYRIYQMVFHLYESYP